MSEERYPDVIELKLKLCFSDAHNSDYMKYLVEISEEAVARLNSNKRVVGTIRKNEGTGDFNFKAFSPVRKPKPKVIGVTPVGRVVETPQRYRSTLSVDKAIGAEQTAQVMTSHLGQLMIQLKDYEANK